MKKKIISVLLCLILTAGLLPATVYAAENWSISSATWQDPNNVVLQWAAQEGYTYQIYRSDTRNGEYALIGTASSGSYRDSDVSWPDAKYYRVQPVSQSGAEGSLSQPIQAGTNPQPLSKVTVVMYHNFISTADMLNGVLFEEYSLDPADFEADLQYLRSNGYTTITSEDLLSYINGEKPLPAKAIILSIDDGTLGVYTNGWPLLQKYRMKADFNVIGEQIDDAWQILYDGGTRDGQSAPYCQWNELVRMQESGEINICSHTYGLHRYNREGRIGASMMDGERLEQYILVIKNDYDLSVSCIGGWTGKNPTTMAYPYSRRSSASDAAILENTGYEILMAGEGARGTASNYFVDGASAESQMRLMSRPCRMENHPLQEYLDAADQQDQANGVNTAENTLALSAEKCAEIARWYSPYADVAGDAWYAGAVYYAYVNTLLNGTSLTEFSPNGTVSRAMAATLLYRMAGEPSASATVSLSDVPADTWYTQAALWAAENNILPGIENSAFLPDQAITREELATALYRYAQLRGLNLPAGSDITTSFSDAGAVSPWAEDAVRWAVSEGIFKGDGAGHLMPQSSLTRAELATILQTWNISQSTLSA